MSSPLWTSSPRSRCCAAAAGEYGEATRLAAAHHPSPSHPTPASHQTDGTNPRRHHQPLHPPAGRLRHHDVDRRRTQPTPRTGGKVEIDGAGADVLEETARREVAEEIGVDVAEVVLTYVESGFFMTDDGDPVINVVFRGELPAHAQPIAASAQEVAGLIWLTVAEAEANANCPSWVLRSLRRAAS
ncbi:NUDIX domain-containing protein [Streptosporangium sp. NPDC006013]|uniref:NUDIX hydrolase n=1 Tax=Streptosporangium sp. NPDC006013 TaxID=3155596 RepID=UPI0033B0AF37